MVRMNCMNCDHHLICRNADDDKNHVCSMYDPIFNRTYADRIRAMSDEELARFISLDDEHDYDGILRWLKQEVE